VKAQKKSRKLPIIQELMKANGSSVKLQLCEAEVRALEFFKSEDFFETTPLWAPAHFAMLFALSQPDAFSKWIGQIRTYCRAEGMNHLDYGRSRLAAQWPHKIARFK
jgi:hypothetical protein